MPTRTRIFAGALAGAALLGLAACGQGGDTTTAATTPAPAPAAAPAPAPAADAAPTPGDLERARLAAMMNVYPDEDAWEKACVGDKVDAKICECAGKATVKAIGEKGLYAWVWQGYINREGTARMRSNRWFTDNAIDTAAQQKFADAVGKCYTT